MRFHKRIKHAEKLLPTIKQDSEDVERVSEWLVQNSEEFRECVRQLFRLQHQVDGFDGIWDDLQQPYREKADVYMNRINQLIEQHIGSVTA